MKKLVTTIGLFLLINTCLISQVSIDYRPKALTNELMKMSKCDKIEMQELSLPDRQAVTSRMGKFFALPESCVVLGVKYVYVGRVNTCRAGGCVMPTNNSEQANEFFDYYILYMTNATILKVKIFNYQSMHGQEVTATSWLKQFKNYDGSHALVVGKNTDAISGATISVDAITSDIEDKTKFLLKILNGLLVK